MWNWQGYLFDFSRLKSRDWELLDCDDCSIHFSSYKSICIKDLIRTFEDLFEDVPNLSTDNEVKNYLSFLDELYNFINVDIEEIVYDSCGILGETLYFILEDGKKTQDLVLEDAEDINRLYRTCKLRERI